MGEALDFGSVGYEESREVVQVGQVYDLDIIRPRFDQYRAEAQRIASDAKALTVQDQESLELAVAGGGKAKRIAMIVETSRLSIIAAPQAFVDGVNGLCRMITDQLVIKKNAKKEITNPDCAENLYKNKIGQHQAKVELERREAERKAREATEALQRKLQAEADEANRKAADEAKARVEAEQKIKREKEEAEARERGAKKAELDRLAKKQEEERLEAIRKAVEDAAKIAVVAPTVVAPVVQEAPRVTRTESGSAFSKHPWIFEIKHPELVPEEYLTKPIPDEKKIKDAVKMGVREIPGIHIYQDTQIAFRT